MPLLLIITSAHGLEVTHVMNMDLHTHSTPLSPHLPHLQGCAGQHTIGSRPHLREDAETYDNSSGVGHSPTRDQSISLCNPRNRKKVCSTIMGASIKDCKGSPTQAPPMSARHPMRKTRFLRVG